MKNLHITLLTTLLLSVQYSIGQNDKTSDKWMEYLEEMASSDMSQDMIETLQADLSYIYSHPFDINKTTAEELLKLPFISESQASDIIKYREKTGRFLSLYELKEIKSLDMETISLIIPFLSIGDYDVDKIPITVNNLVSKSKNELIIRANRCFQQKAGYCSYSDSILQKYPNRVYSGEPLYTSLRYSYSFDDRIYFSFVAEKDAGESFFKGKHKGYDYYSLNFLMKDVNKWLKTFAAGDYRLSFGQGLIINNGFYLSKTSLVTQMENRNKGIRRHYSTSETNFFRGLAGTISIKNVDLSLFYSHKRIDANVKDGEITSFKTDGLHRTQLEMSKKNIVATNCAGINIKYSKNKLHLGVTGLYYDFGNMKVNPTLKEYNKYYFRGNNNINIGVDYKYGLGILNFFGETAMSINGSLATLNALQINPASYCSLILLQRYYDKSYHAYYADAFSQSSGVINEQGVYMGMRIHPIAYWQLSFYADIYKYPWLRYGVDSSSKEKEYMAQVDYNRLKNFSFYIRYRYKDHANYDKNQLRFRAVYSPNEFITLKTSLDGNMYEETEEDKPTYGYMISQSVSFDKRGVPFNVDVFAGWFDVDNYYNRTYSYEKNLLYAYESNSFYGKGIRTSVVIKYKLLKTLTFSSKFGLTKYLNRETIGSNLEKIDGSLKTDLLLMIGFKF